jgi:hypothetical protein
MLGEQRLHGELSADEREIRSGHRRPHTARDASFDQIQFLNPDLYPCHPWLRIRLEEVFFCASLWPKQSWAKRGHIPFRPASVMARTKI